MKEEVIAFTDPKSPVSEMFKTLRTNIQFMNTNKALKTLLVTSTLPGEGKSWTVANLAVTFAQAGKKVLIIDADMRKGRQFGIFEIPPTPGLSNYLSGVIDGEEGDYELDKFLHKTELDNLFIMPAGNVPPNPTELLVSEKMIDLISKVKEAYDMTIFDGTPGLLVADASIISRIVDSTIIVTAHNETKIDNVSEVKKAIENIGGKVAGVVINKIPESSKKYESKYYYGHTTAPTVIKEKKKIDFKKQFFKEEKNKNGSKKEKAESVFKTFKRKRNDDIAKDIYSRFEPVEDYENNIYNEIINNEILNNEMNIIPVDTIEQPIENIEVKTENIKQPIENIEVKTENVEQPIENIEVKTENIKQPIENIEVRAENIKQPIENIEVKTENIVSKENNQPAVNLDNVKQEDIKLDEIKLENIKTDTFQLENNSNTHKEFKIESESEHTNQPNLTWEQEAETAYNKLKQSEMAESTNNTKSTDNIDPEYTLETTQDILFQINQYLEKQKNKLNNGGNND